MKICHLCNELVTSSKINFKERTYHLECFKCKKCKKTLNAINAIEKENNLLLCQTCSSEIVVNECFKCKELLIKGQSYKIIKGNLFFHSECFVCAGPCNKPLKERYFHKNEHYFCKECFDLISPRCNKCQQKFEPRVSRISLKDNIFLHNECFLCSHCNQIIKSEYLLTKSNDYLCMTCNDLMAKRCNKCGQILKSDVEYKKIGENIYFHTYCFTCTGPCKKPITTMFYEEKSGDYICKECKEINADRCSKCKQIFNPGISYRKLSDDIFFHKECFICAGPCGKPINSSFFKNDDNEYLCTECNDLDADRCFKCQQIFEPGSSYEVIKENVFFHSECFLCWGPCKKQLSSSFIESEDGNFYCLECNIIMKRLDVDQNLNSFENIKGKGSIYVLILILVKMNGKFVLTKINFC